MTPEIVAVCRPAMATQSGGRSSLGSAQRQYVNFPGAVHAEPACSSWVTQFCTHVESQNARRYEDQFFKTKLCMFWEKALLAERTRFFCFEAG